MTVQGPETGFRCSTVSRDLGEPREGTASTVRAFVLLECPGPWGAEALRDARLDTEVKARLRQLERETGIRPLLIRRASTGPGRRPPRVGHEPVRLVVAWTRGARPWAESALLADPRDVLDLDLLRLARGESVGLEPHPDPLHLVCTHGRHDACCAERGRPVATAFGRSAPEQSWEVSHIGGDRFAPNLLALPQGLYYGGLEPTAVEAFLATHLAGQLDLEHLRGRTAYGFAVQAAEVELRRRLGLRDGGVLRVLRRERADALTRVVFELPTGPWEVVIRTTPGPTRRLTCSATGDAAPLVHEFVTAQPLPAVAG